MKQIKMWTVNKIKYRQVRIFEEEDSNYPNWYAVRANERAIEHYIKDYSEEEKKELRELIKWTNDNCKKTLEEHGWKVI